MQEFSDVVTLMPYPFQFRSLKTSSNAAVNSFGDITSPCRTIWLVLTAITWKIAGCLTSKILGWQLRTDKPRPPDLLYTSRLDSLNFIDVELTGIYEESPSCHLSPQLLWMAYGFQWEVASSIPAMVYFRIS